MVVVVVMMMMMMMMMRGEGIDIGGPQKIVEKLQKIDENCGKIVEN